MTRSEQAVFLEGVKWTLDTINVIRQFLQERIAAETNGLTSDAYKLMEGTLSDTETEIRAEMEAAAKAHYPDLDPPSAKEIEMGKRRDVGV